MPPSFRVRNPNGLRNAILEGSEGLTDKVNVPSTDHGQGPHSKHRYQHMYHRYLRTLVSRVCDGMLHADATNNDAMIAKNTQQPNRKIRILEIGLGCDPGGGMIRGTPGGSARGWRHLFPSPAFELDLHIMEYDQKCAQGWAAHNPTIAKVHVGDQSSPEDLDRVVRESGGQSFDVIIDDGSHLNKHQIFTVQHMIQHVNKDGGIYVIED